MKYLLKFKSFKEDKKIVGRELDLDECNTVSGAGNPLVSIGVKIVSSAIRNRDRIIKGWKDGIKQGYS